MTQLAQQIRALRTAKNLSQDGLAEKLYISRQANSIFPVRLFPSGKMVKQRQILINWSSWQKFLMSV